MKLSLKLFLALLIIATISCSKDNSIEETSTIDEITETIESLEIPQTKTIEIEILNLINQYREDLNLNKLEKMSVIKAVAYTHTYYMLDKGEISHDNHIDRFNYLVANAGAVAVGENLACGFNSTTELVEAWLESDSHKLTIEGNFTNFDISAEQDDEGKWYFTNIFIKK